VTGARETAAAVVSLGVCVHGGGGGAYGTLKVVSLGVCVHGGGGGAYGTLKVVSAVESSSGSLLPSLSVWLSWLTRSMN
jgi:hypothetical protein